MKTYKNMWIKSIGILLFLSSMLLLSQPAIADVVNINKADAAALQENLEGIGPVKAEAIIKYRKKNGSFKSVNDLGNVPGIGKETLLKNKKNLSTSRGLKKAAVNKLKNNDNKKAKAKKKLKGESDKTKKKFKTDKKRIKDKSSKKTKLDKKSLKRKSDKKLKKEKLKKAKAKKKLKKIKGE